MTNDNVSVERVIAIEQALTGLRHIEYGDIAKYPHSKGEIFRRGNVNVTLNIISYNLLKAKKDILVGDSFNDSNCEDISVFTEIEKINTSIDTVSDIIEAVNIGGAGIHNSIYRGKNLGSSVTDEQYLAIRNGKFDGMWIGDFWRINNVNYRIAHFDYWLNTGDTNTTKHHVVLVPDTSLYSASMNDTNTTEGGYAFSKMRTEYLEQARTIISNAFGSNNILVHRELFTNSVVDGKARSFAWYDSDIDIMNGGMVYGHEAFASSPYLESAVDKSQLKLFIERSDIINNGSAWWLRVISSDENLALIDSHGPAGTGVASRSLGVRPAFGIC